MDYFSKIPFGVPQSSYLSSLTHIELNRWDTSHLRQLAHLPRLTHVCLPDPGHGQIRVRYMETVCSSCPRLEVLIILCDPTFLSWVEGNLSLSSKGDHRIVVQPKCREVIGDWEKSYFGGSDIWSRAEATVELRKKNLVGWE
jgi:hypothetical protein